MYRNWKAAFIFSTVCVCALTEVQGKHASNGKPRAHNFVLTINNGELNETEFFVQHNAKKSLQFGLTDRTGLKVVEVTNGKVLLKNIYDAATGELEDCDISKDTDEISKFIIRFRTKTDPILKLDQMSSEALKLEIRSLAELPFDRRESLNMRKLRRACKNFQIRTMRHARKSHKTENRRSKRGLMIYPGTNWCGKGNRAKYVSDFGKRSVEDRCCLQHDGCPYIIEGLSNRYNYFNYRLHTLSFCLCDERFNRCLKAANTGTANIIGKVYFNVMNSQCFDLQRERACAERTWWGSCNKQALQLVAKVRPTKSF